MNKRTRVSDLIQAAGGNMAEAARRVGVTRAAVHQWVTGGREYIPELAEYRLAEYKAAQSERKESAA